MSWTVVDAMSHIRFCVAEMMAEIDEGLACDERVRALAQLDARESEGRPLEAVCGRALRASLEGAIGAGKLARARLKLAELQAILDGPERVETGPGLPVATATAEVVVLAAHREAKAQPAGERKPARAAARALGIGALFMLGALAATPIVSPLARMQVMEFVGPMRIGVTPPSLLASTEGP